MAYSGAMPEQAEKPDDMKLSDADLCSILQAEKQNSVGFENGTELEKKRRTALEYSKGEMKDVVSLPNRSKATSTDVADAIETVLPDLMEIFTGGEDVASFDPQGNEDEEAAKQEIEYVKYVAFRKLRGWRLLYTAIKDALQVDTGILKTWWEDKEAIDEQSFDGINAPQMMMLEQDGYTIDEKTPLPPGPDGMELFKVKASMSYDDGCIKCAAIDPNNLSVAPDTVDISDATYCVVRSFPRAQSLMDQGFDPKLVEKLPDYPNRGDEQTEQSRDLADESDSSNAGASNKLLRTVQVLEHWVRIDGNQDGKTELWRIQTDEQCNIILDKRQVNRIGLAVGTPFIQTHRFYGQSLADKLIEIQKIKTALVRMMLDSGYFAMNQRVEVAKDLASEETMDDVLRNEPGMPIRVQKPGAVNPVQAGQLGFDVQLALEYVSTMAEQRSGVVRNAQGLNPDTLHDTKGGALALMGMAQKRVRMIARVLAETLVKGWFLDIHALSRKHATRPDKIRLRGKWVDVNPSEFGDRADMVIEVGVGAGGKEMELAALSKLLEFQKEVLINHGPTVSWENNYNALKRFCERAGFKAPELFFTDPAAEKQKKEEENAKRAAMGQPPIEEPPEPPSPEQMKVQGELQLQEKKHADTMALEGQKLQAKQQADQVQLAAKAQQDAAQADRDFQLKQMQIAADERAKAAQAAAELDMKREQMAADMALKRDQMFAEIELKRGQLNAELQMNLQIEQMKIAAGIYAPKSNGSGGTSEVHLGGEAGA